MRMGIMRATMGVLFRKAEANMTGIIMRTCNTQQQGAAEWRASVTHDSSHVT
jgi:hypothetical protein